MPEIHAKLSASGAHRWLNCPGSVKLESTHADTDSVYAKEGTLAHSLGELKLNKYFKGMGPKKYKADLNKFKNHELYQKEMDSYTDDYLNYIKTKALAYDSQPYVNIEERVNFSKYVPEGFGTCDCVMIHGSELTIIDLKYGKGVPVSPVKNPQLMLYALGAYLNYSLIYSIDKITMCIVQPRLDIYEDYTITKDELLEFANDIKDIAKEAYNGSDRLKSGDHCKFCKAKYECSERAKSMFKKVETIKPATQNKELRLNADDISFYLKAVEGVKDWIDDLKNYALEQCLQGVEIAGFKAVEGRSNRCFKHIDNAFNKLIDSGIDEAMLYERKPLSLTKIEKLVGKKEFNSLLSEEIIKPQGKPTLVKDSDKREAINSTKNLFKNLELEKEGK